MSMFRHPTLLASAKDKPCSNCGRNDGTVVAAHSNDLSHGKGSGLKAHDVFHARLCHGCHDFVDGRAPTERTGRYQPTHEDRRECQRRAMFATWLTLAQEGWISTPKKVA